MKQLRPKYKTWIRAKKTATFSVLTMISILGLFLLPFSIYALILLISAGVFGYISFILLYSSYLLSERGGNFQNKIHALLLSKLPDDGLILDIGCGNGNLAIKCAQGSEERTVKGVDYWGDNWEYSRKQCEINATLEGVSDRVSFEKGSASNLPYDDSSMDAVISCLTFHEVSDVSDKSICVQEALRVLKAEGCFAFFDLFNDAKYFPEQGAILEKIGQNRGIIEENDNVEDRLNLKFPLNQKKVLGSGKLLIGRKLGSTAKLTLA